MQTRKSLSAGFLAPLAAALALAATPGHGASVTYLLDQSNALGDGVNYLQVTVSDGANGAIDFSVQALSPLTGMAGNNFGIQSFAFNVVAGGDAEAASIDGLPGGWRATNGKRMDGFGLFDIKLAGRGNNRLSTLSFSITGIDGDSIDDYAVYSTGNAGEGHQYFAAHVAGFEPSDCNGCGNGDYDKVSSYDRARPRLFAQSASAHPGSSAHDRHGWSRSWQHDWEHGMDDKWDDDVINDCITSAFFGGSTPGSEVPLPASAWLFGAGLLGVAARARRRKAALAA